MHILAEHEGIEWNVDFDMSTDVTEGQYSYRVDVLDVWREDPLDACSVQAAPESICNAIEERILAGEFDDSIQSEVLDYDRR